MRKPGVNVVVAIAVAVLLAGVRAATQSSATTSQPPPAATKPAPVAPAAQQPPPMPGLPPASAEKPALSLPAPFYPTTPPLPKQLIFERVYNYSRMNYVPAIVIQKITRQAAPNATPEQAFAAQMSAMLAGDYDWWLSNWDLASQKFHLERNQQTNRTPAEWRSIWERGLRGQQIVLTERLQTGPFGPYVLLVYELRDAAGKMTLKSSFVAKQEAGRFVATLELAEDPIFQYYEMGKDRVSITVR